MNTILFNQLNLSNTFDSRDFSTAEKVVFWTAILTPVWWLLGIQPLFYPSVVIFLLIANFRIDAVVLRGLPICIWAWLLMTIAMFWTAILGLNDMKADSLTYAAAFVTFFKSYLMIFAAMALPFFCKLRIDVITRAIALMSIGFFINIVVQMMLLAVGVNGNTFEPFEPFLARVLPGSGEASSSLLIIPPSIQPFFGIPMPRVVLHTADPPILGFCALLCFLVCLTESNERLRRLSLVSSLAALILSFSRSSWLGLLFAGVVIALFNNRKVIHFPFWIASGAFFISSVFGFTVNQILDRPRAFFSNARAESDKVRDIVVQATLDAWLEKKWLGWGVIRGSAWLYDDSYISLGSFSTYAAVLYLNGVVGFIIFIAALAATLYNFFRFAFYENNFRCQIAFTGYLALVALIQATPLSWMAIYLWFFFIWSGATLRDAFISSEASF